MSTNTTTQEIQNYIQQVLNKAAAEGRPYNLENITAKCPICAGTFTCLKDENCWCNMDDFKPYISRVPPGLNGCVCQMSLLSLPKPEPHPVEMPAGQLPETPERIQKMVRAITTLDKRTKALGLQDSMLLSFLVEKGILKREDVEEFIRRVNEELKKK